MLTGGPSRSHAETGSVRLKITKVGFIVGVGGGSGVLHFKGKNYRLGIGGVSAGTIGAAGADLLGPPPIFGLQRTSRVPIPPSLLGLQWRAAQGSNTTKSNGVVLQLQGRQVGFEASLSLSGMTKSLQ
jgi:hypothetical protein